MVPDAVSLGVKRQQPEVELSSPPSADVPMMLSHCELRTGTRLSLCK
jgi:hypothetical protein